ncbi:hypothetical protein L7Q78_05845 [Achromobacter xylosoxidans]|uniref:hypothetical protein n=1 Tax=Alcaligenes xylosoxydans xylosoxydans TaxID=85698 RepID=UPI001F06D144|nr:hypothetical protein [Achromobacter xylosoxidans]MCH1986481.1 hypothetical protein [Achromobacter xylosoxidans]MCH1992283.1 hypothetical protein [Achromobacter xylosoxidans]MCH4586602.1 hypothetical protein [Achromobacter xylosoxidans]
MPTNVVLYIRPACAQSDLSKVALTDRGIKFTLRSATEYAAALSVKGFSSAPVLTVTVENELIAWEGHRPELIEMLADLMDTGPVGAHGLRDRDAAEDAVLTRFQIMQEIRDHQLSAEGFFADHGNLPLYRGRDLLNWLGY